MRVEVVSTVEARNDLVNLLLARTPGVRADDAARVAGVYLDDIEEKLIDNDGILPLSVRIRGSDGHDLWCEYCNGVWVFYSYQDAGGLFGGAVRRVTIRGFVEELLRG